MRECSKGFIACYSTYITCFNCQMVAIVTFSLTATGCSFPSKMDVWLQHLILTCDGCQIRGLIGGNMSICDFEDPSNTSNRHCTSRTPPSLRRRPLRNHRYLSQFRCWGLLFINNIKNNTICNNPNSCACVRTLPAVVN